MNAQSLKTFPIRLLRSSSRDQQNVRTSSRTTTTCSSWGLIFHAFLDVIFGRSALCGVWLRLCLCVYASVMVLYVLLRFEWNNSNPVEHTKAKGRVYGGRDENIGDHFHETTQRRASVAVLVRFFKHETTAWKKLMFTAGWPSVDHVFHEPYTTVTDCAKAQTTKKPTTQPRCQIWVGRLTLGKQYCCGALFAIKGPHSRDKRTTCGGGKK